LLQAAGAERVLEESTAISVIDQFVLQHRLPDGRTPVERYVDARKDLSPVEREMLLGWRDVVEGLFEVRARDGDALVLLNLIDDLEYRTYSNMGRTAFRGMSKGGFVVGRLVPIAPYPGTWLVSGGIASFRKADGPQIAQIALETAAEHPALVFRNPDKIAQGWERMHRDREAFIACFGADQVVLPPVEAQEGSMLSTGTAGRPPARKRASTTPPNPSPRICPSASPRTSKPRTLSASSTTPPRA
jgi:hypothetical protein